jgi:hypothetical protein
MGNVLFTNEPLFALVNLLSHANFFHASKAGAFEDDSTIAFVTFFAFNAMRRANDAFFGGS